MRMIRQAGERLGRRLTKIPAVELVHRIMVEVSHDDVSHMAAGVAYYAVLSLFPLLLGLIALIGFFLPYESVQQQLLEFFEGFLPGSGDVVRDNIGQVIRLRGAVGLLSLVGLFWSASAMFGAIGRAINRAWDVHRDRPFMRRKARDLGMALSIGLLFLVSLGANSLLTGMSGVSLPFLGPVGRIVAGAVGLGLKVGILLAIYKLMPNTKTYWRYIWPGAALAAALLFVAESVFVFYLGNFASYDRVYGSLGSLVALLVWIYVSAFILLLGAEASSEYGRWRCGVARGVLLASVEPAREEPEDRQ